MPDDMLKDAIETAERVLEECDDFEAHGMCNHRLLVRIISMFH